MIFPLPWHHVHLTQPQREGAAAWWVKCMGAQRGEPTKRSENLWYGKNLVQIQSDTAIKAPRSGEFDHIGLAVPDIQRAIQFGIEGGAKRTGDDIIEDPWGTRVRFTESDAPGFHHVTVKCNEPAASAGWYAANIGGEAITCPWDKDCLAVQYDTMWMVFGQVDKPLAGPAAIRPICHVGWYTDNISATVKIMQTRGCRFPVPVRPFGPIQLAFVEDPSGLWVELVEPRGGKIPK